MNEMGIKWTICLLLLKRKKTCYFNHFRRKCISSDTKWLYIINAEHCISSNRRKIHSDEWWYTAQRADEIHAEAWWYAKPAVWIKKSYQNNTTFLVRVTGQVEHVSQSETASLPWRTKSAICSANRQTLPATNAVGVGQVLRLDYTDQTKDGTRLRTVFCLVRVTGLEPARSRPH